MLKSPKSVHPRRRYVAARPSSVPVKSPRHLWVGVLALVGIIFLVSIIVISRPFIARAIEGAYRLETIIIEEGRVQTPREDIMRAIGVNQGDSIIRFNLESIQKRLLALPWIESAGVERLLPDSLVIRVRERIPLARWRLGTNVFVVDAKGNIVKGVSADSFNHLSLIAGEGAPENLQELKAALEPWPVLAKDMTEAKFISRRRWDITLRNSLVIKLPETGIRDALQRAVAAIENDRLLERGVKGLDVRMADRLFIDLGEHNTEGGSIRK